MQQEVSAQALRSDAIRSEAAQALAKQAGLTPVDIKKYGDATVYIHNLWQLYDRETNRPIYQKMTNVNGEMLPAYVRMNDGKLVRWLTLDNDKDNSYKPVGKDHSGSGFVIGENGFILTNKHVAAGWTSEYEDFPYYNWTRGSVYGVGQSDRHDTERNVNLVRSLNQLGSGERRLSLRVAGVPTRSPMDVRDFYGRNDLLTVQFPGTRIDINATLLRTSIDADVAEIKVELDPRVEQARACRRQQRADRRKDRPAGLSRRLPGDHCRPEIERRRPDPRTRDLYPRADRDRRHRRQDADQAAQGYRRRDDIRHHRRHLSARYLCRAGTQRRTGAQLSGKVIALLSLVSTSAQNVSFAVPVSYVRELLQPQRNASP